MGREKVIDEVVKTVSNGSNGSNGSTTSNILLQYAPLIIGLICLVVCYLLFKKIQTLNSNSDSVSKIEKQFTNFVKEQSEVNTINGKKYNAIISQINQLSYIVQNLNSRESNTLSSQMSPERDNVQQQVQQAQKVQQVQQVQKTEKVQQQQVQQPEQRELMPTSVIQTNFPIKPETETLPTPISTTNKKQVDNLPTLEQQQQKETKSNNKKVIDLQTLKEEVLIEEASSDED